MSGLRVLLACALAAGCQREASAPLTDSTFIAVMGDLRRLQNTLGRQPDSTQRGAILRRYRVTADQLEQTAGVIGNDLDRAATVWHAIEKRITDTTATPARP